MLTKDFASLETIFLAKKQRLYYSLLQLSVWQVLQSDGNGKQRQMVVSLVCGWWGREDRTGPRSRLSGGWLWGGGCWGGCWCWWWCWGLSLPAVSFQFVFRCGINRKALERGVRVEQEGNLLAPEALHCIGRRCQLSFCHQEGSRGSGLKKVEHNAPIPG